MKSMMKTIESLRNVQDSNRDEGWRIKWIPWQEPGQLEFVYNTPLTTVAGIAGFLLFLGALGYYLLHGGSPWILGVAGLGWVLLMLGRFYAAWHKQRGWSRVRARCVDRELREFSNIYVANSLKNWQFRLLCEYEFEGMTVRVTPEPSRLLAFRSGEEAQKYLAEHIAANSDCALWINLRNPRQASFPDRKKM